MMNQPSNTKAVLSNCDCRAVDAEQRVNVIRGVAIAVFYGVHFLVVATDSNQSG